MKKLLLLTDFSAVSKKAITFAQTLFDNTPAEFRIIHTYPSTSEPMYGSTLVLDAIEEAAQQQLATLLADITNQPVPGYHKYITETHIGDPVLTTELILEQDDVDYVIVGASGSHNRELFGSTATGLIRNCQTNILVVPAFAPIRPLNEVVIAADPNSLQSLDTLKPLRDLLATKNARVTLLTIANKRIDATELEVQQKAIADYLNVANVEPYIIHDTTIEHGISDYLDTHEVDLLVTIPHQKSLFDVLKGSSVTRKLAFKPQVPLLTLFDKKPVTQPQPYEGEIVVGGLLLY